MSGTLYGVGVGPGDPELLTLKAVRVIRSCPVIASPDTGEGEKLALSIAGEYIGGKELLLCPLPMTRDPEALAEGRRISADMLCARLERGQDIAFLTLGDPAVYSTYRYLHGLVKARGYPAETVPGVPSFCAAAAALDVPLCEGGEPLHILPAACEELPEALSLPGTKVLMKSGGGFPQVLEALREKDLLGSALLAERCGLPDQRLLRGLSEFSDTPGYFTVILVKE